MNCYTNLLLKISSFKMIASTSTSTYFVKPISSRHTFFIHVLPLSLRYKNKPFFLFFSNWLTKFGIYFDTFIHIAFRLHDVRAISCISCPRVKYHKKATITNTHSLLRYLYESQLQCIELFKNKIHNNRVVSYLYFLELCLH